ncbi:MAG: GNAT family N-acetyltransferase [Promethearchaeota archaeon]
MKNWRDKFGDRELSAKEAIGLIQPGQKIFIHSGCSEPQALTKELINQHKYLKDIEIHHFLSVARDLPLKDKPEDLFRFNAFFIAQDSIRDAVNSGQADYTPMFLSEIPGMFQTRKTIDVALIQVSPPDKNGFCSLGVNVDVAKPIAESADMIIAEINPKVPRTVGNSLIPMKKINYFIYNDTPLLEYNYSKPGKNLMKIARNVASLIPNEATIQVGIGRTPHAVLYALENHKDLGVHTDTIFNKYIDLVENEIITCEKKTYNHGRIIASFALGTNKLFKFLDDSLFFEFHPSTYTNNIFNIARNNQMIAINGALQVDLLGQVNTTSIPSKDPKMAPLIYQGIGGLVDFSRGASFSKGGKSIICLPSTTMVDGKLYSRILPMFPAGTHVSLTMGDVHYVVTEYGVANLRYKNIRERILSLISIAHPQFRKWLLEEAKKFKFIYSDQTIAMDEKGNVIKYPRKYEKKFATKNGEIIFFRPIKPTDERLIQDLYYSLDTEDRIFRFFRKKKYFTRNDSSIKMNLNIDYENIMVLVGTVGDLESERIIAICSYQRDPMTNMAEIAFTVHRDWRDKGLTKFMLNYLARIAREKGIDGFQGEIMWQNQKMVHIIKNSGYIIKGRTEGEDWIFEFKFNERI